MLFSFQIMTDELTKWHTLTVHDGERTYELVARKGHSRHVYTNLPVCQKPIVDIPIPARYEELSFGEEEFMSEEQARLNRKLENTGETPFSRVVRGTPSRAVVTFPHFKGQGGWPAPYSILDGSKLDLDDCLYLSFQDPYFHLGSYLLADNFGNDPKPGVVAAIRYELASFGISEENMTILGASKGASSALMVSQYFEGNQLIVCSLSTDLNFPIRKSKYSHIGVALDYFGVTYPSTIDLLLDEAQEKETHWFYSTSDVHSNQGNEIKNAPQLSKYACEVGHTEVIGENLDRISVLIQAFSKTKGHSTSMNQPASSQGASR